MKSRYWSTQEKYQSEEYMDMYNEDDKRIVLCGANAYEQKYYFNEKFNGIPESIKEELHIICVLFTEEVGGVFTIVFEEDGSVSFDTDAYGANTSSIRSKLHPPY